MLFRFVVALTEPYTTVSDYEWAGWNSSDYFCLKTMLLQSKACLQDRRCLTDMEYTSCGVLDAVLIIMG